MISIDANILLYGFSEASPHHIAARDFLLEMGTRENVVLSEFVLSEFYLLLRNPIIFDKPLDPDQAVAVIQSYRHHPLWRIAGFPSRSQAIHSRLWNAAAAKGFARRRIYDLRTALCLQAFGVDSFATANLKDFEGTGFSKVWNPLKS